MSEQRRKEVEAAIRKIEAFHLKGRLLLDQREHDSASGKVKRKGKGGNSTEKELMLKARQFADPARGGYSLEKLVKLCHLIRVTQTDQADALRIFSRQHVIYLLTVRGSRREMFQRKAIKLGWSSRDLLREIGADHGTRKGGGRRRRLPSDRKGLLTAFEKECETWRRLGLALERGDASEHEPVSVAELDDNLMPHFNAASFAIQKFHQALTKALSAMNPDWNRRTALRQKETGPTQEVDSRKQSRNNRTP